VHIFVSSCIANLNPFIPIAERATGRHLWPSRYGGAVESGTLHTQTTKKCSVVVSSATQANVAISHIESANHFPLTLHTLKMLSLSQCLTLLQVSRTCGDDQLPRRDNHTFET
jgi:hypothetical protein